MSQKCIGECGNCGSKVYIPLFFYSIHPPQPQCHGCGCKVQSGHLPVLPVVNPPDETPKGQKYVEKEFAKGTGAGNLQEAVENLRQQSLPFVPLTPKQKSEVQEKIEETRELVQKIQKTQQEKELTDLQSEKLADMEKSIDKLENMMVLVAQTLKEIKQRLPQESPKDPFQTEYVEKDVTQV